MKCSTLFNLPLIPGICPHRSLISHHAPVSTTEQHTTEWLRRTIATQEQVRRQVASISPAAQFATQVLGAVIM